MYFPKQMQKLPSPANQGFLKLTQSRVNNKLRNNTVVASMLKGCAKKNGKTRRMFYIPGAECDYEFWQIGQSLFFFEIGLAE